MRVTSRTGRSRRIWGRFWKSQLVETRHRSSWDETCLGGRRLVFACSWRPLWRVPHVLGWGCRWKIQYRKTVPLSLCGKTFKLKGNKKKFRTWTEKSLRVFRVSKSYVLCIYVINVPCTFRIFMYMALVHYVCIAVTAIIRLYAFCSCFVFFFFFLLFLMCSSSSCIDLYTQLSILTSSPPHFLKHRLSPSLWFFEFLAFCNVSKFLVLWFIWLVGWLFGFYGVSTFVGYLMSNPFLNK